MPVALEYKRDQTSSKFSEEIVFMPGLKYGFSRGRSQMEGTDPRQIQLGYGDFPPKKWIDVLHRRLRDKIMELPTRAIEGLGHEEPWHLESAEEVQAALDALDQAGEPPERRDNTEGSVQQAIDEQLDLQVWVMRVKERTRTLTFWYQNRCLGFTGQTYEKEVEQIQIYDILREVVCPPGKQRKASGSATRRKTTESFASDSPETLQFIREYTRLQEETDERLRKSVVLPIHRSAYRDVFMATPPSS